MRPKARGGPILLISNYSQEYSYTSVLSVLTSLITQRTGLYPQWILVEMITGIGIGIKITFKDQDQYDAVHSCNGCFVLKSRIWIVQFPSVLGSLCPTLTSLFRTHTWHGQVDLSGLANQFEQLGENPRQINFNDLIFVEFLLFHLGTEARDERFLVRTLLLNNNNIEDVNKWAPFMHFLPDLHLIVLTENPLKFAPTALATKRIRVEATGPNLPKPRQETPKGKWWGEWGALGTFAQGSNAAGGVIGYNLAAGSTEDEKRPAPTVQVFEFTEPDAATLELLKHPVAIIG
jgi:hypothetical protein